MSPNLEKVAPEGWGPRRVGAPKGGGPKPRRVGHRKVGHRRVGGPKFRAFFPLPATIFFLSSLSWGSFRGILVGFLKRRGPEMCTFGVLGLSCASPGSPVWSHNRHTHNTHNTHTTLHTTTPMLFFPEFCLLFYHACLFFLSRLSFFYFVPMSFFLSRVFVFFVPFVVFLFCPECLFFFVPFAFFCPDNRLLIVSRFCFFCPVAFFLSRWFEPAHGKRGGTQSWPGQKAEHGWLSSGEKWEDDFLTRQPIS